MAVSTKIKWIGALLAVCAGFIYFRFDPAQYLFPRCPFLWLTGFKCPGCGSQRALHQLLHGNITAAFHDNFLMVVSIPYLLAGFFIQSFQNKMSFSAVRKKWFGYAASRLIFVIVMLFWVSRNLFGF